MPGADDALLHTFESCFKALAGAIAGGWYRRGTGAYAVVTGAPASTLNGVLPAAGEPAGLRELLDEVAATGLPHCLQLRPGVEADTSGLERIEDLPLMTTDRVPVAECDAAIRLLEPDEASTHWELASPAFGAPVEVFAHLIPAHLLERPELRCYVAERDGTALSTGLGWTDGEYVGVFNVATPEAGRRQGLGGAITARAVADGFAAGASRAYLQSSPMGLRVYEALGFATVETWACWVSTAG